MDQPTTALLPRNKVKAFLRRLASLLLIGALLYGAVAVIYATKTIYKVRRNYAVVVEGLSGERTVVQEVGWHGRLPIFTRLEQEFPLMNQQLYLGGSSNAQQIMTRGNVALWVSAMLTYRIVDLERWGIENRNAQELLQNDFDGIVKDVMQEKEVDALISDREKIKEEIFTALRNRAINNEGAIIEKKFGISLVSFVLIDTRFGEKLAAASEEKKRRQLIAEAENYAADLEASRIKKLYRAYSDAVGQFRQSLDLGPGGDKALFEFLNQQKWAAAYEKNQQGQNTFVLNNAGSQPGLNLPVPSPADRKNDGPGTQNEKSSVR